MRLALQKTTLIDFPGRLACVAFLPGCDLACPFCHNAELARPGSYPGFLEGLSERGELIDFLKKRKGVLEGVVFSGGEPLLDKGLPGLVSEARALGYLVKVDTNGMHPEALKSIDADFVSIDIKADPRKYHGLIPGSPVNAAERLIQSIEAVRGRKIDHEFRTTLAPGIVDGRDIAAIGALVKPGESWILQRFRPGRTLDPSFTDRLPYDERQYGSMAEAARFFTEAARLR